MFSSVIQTPEYLQSTDTSRNMQNFIINKVNFDTVHIFLLAPIDAPRCPYISKEKGRRHLFYCRTPKLCHQCRPPASQMMLVRASSSDCAGELLNQAAYRVTSVVVFIANTSPAGRSSSWSHSKRPSAPVAIATCTPCRREVPTTCIYFLHRVS